MDIRELAKYCWADRDFFDSPDRVHDEDTRYADPTKLDGRWHRTLTGAWVCLRPTGIELPEQGWKIHVSTTPADSAKVLDIVWRYCAARPLAFKYLRSERLLLVMNEKNFPRELSGKFVTIYPRDDAELLAVLPELDELLAAYPGPYVLGDLRHGGGPLYLRYGAFRELWCADGNGGITHAVRKPDGALVPDRRAPFFTTPDWVVLPAPLGPDLRARQRTSEEDFPYRIERAVQFANGGGIYLATDDRTAEKVIVREARPYAGLDAGGRDAVARLQAARRALEQLAGLPCVPRLIDYRIVQDHHFLIEEYLDGCTLQVAVATRHPLADPGASVRDLADYRDWAAGVLTESQNALAAVHSRGLALGDLHPGNIIVRPDDTVAFVDFELASDLATVDRPALGAPGFSAPEPLTGAAADRYALEYVRLMTLLPLVSLIERDRTKLPTLIEAAAAELPGSRPASRRLLRSLGHDAARVPPDHAGAMFADPPANWPRIRASLAAAIQASATPERDDRLFPGDPAQFTTGGIDLATGAAGVLYALHRTGNPVAGDHVDWLATHALALRAPLAGLFTGLHGAALVLDLLGLHGQAREVLDRVRGQDGCAGVIGLRSGQAGVALSLLRLARRAGDGDLLERAIVIADRLSGLASDHTDGLRPPERPGLLRGLTGVAAALLRFFQETGNPRYLDAAETCLHRDLTRCAHRSGALYVLEGSRYLPYLDSGSLGLAVVGSRLLRYRADPALATAVPAVRRACDVPFAFQSGLAQGRAGIVLGLTEIGHPDDADLIQGHLRRLGWHAVRSRHGVAFPGAQLLRLSMDLFTGSAGVLLAMHAAVENDGTFLPFLDTGTGPRDVRKEVKPHGESAGPAEAGR